jgi:predicted DNA-binding protein (UPF0278 family)
LITREFLQIKVPAAVLREVDQLTNAQAEELGIETLEVSMQQMREANVRGGPSQQDRLCFISARDNDGAVWSNDKGLRQMCKENGVRVFWGLEMLLVLIKGGHLSEARARKAAKRIHEVDAHYITNSVLDNFMRRLQQL